MDSWIGGGPIMVEETFMWSDGRLLAGVDLAAGATGSVDVSQVGLTVAAQIMNRGTLTVSGAGTLNVSRAATIENLGMLEASAGVAFNHLPTGTSSITNRGLLVVSGAEAGVRFEGGPISLEQTAGALRINGWLRVADGAQITLSDGKLTGTGSLVAGPVGRIVLATQTSGPLRVPLGQTLRVAGRHGLRACRSEQRSSRGNRDRRPARALRRHDRCEPRPLDLRRCGVDRSAHMRARAGTLQTAGTTSLESGEVVELGPGALWTNRGVVASGSAPCTGTRVRSS